MKTLVMSGGEMLFYLIILAQRSVHWLDGYLRIGFLDRFE